MKRILALVLMMTLLLTSALAEFNLDGLKTDADMYSFTQFGTVDTVYRAVNQPYIGQADEGYDGGLVAYVPIVLGTAAIGSVLVQVLYLPLRKVLNR